MGTHVKSWSSCWKYIITEAVILCIKMHDIVAKMYLTRRCDKMSLIGRLRFSSTGKCDLEDSGAQFCTAPPPPLHPLPSPPAMPLEKQHVLWILYLNDWITQSKSSPLVPTLHGPSSTRKPVRELHPGPPLSHRTTGSSWGLFSDSTNLRIIIENTARCFNYAALCEVSQSLKYKKELM